MFKERCEKILPAQKRGLRIFEPERFLAALWLKIPSYIRLTFVSAFIAGLLAHFYVISRKLPNLDDIGHLFDGGHHGRRPRQNILSGHLALAHSAWCATDFEGLRPGASA